MSYEKNLSILNNIEIYRDKLLIQPKSLEWYFYPMLILNSMLFVLIYILFILIKLILAIYHVILNNIEPLQCYFFTNMRYQANMEKKEKTCKM